MKCPICARETDSDAVFCEICGKKIPRCPSCGKVLYERSRFCDHDGAPLPEELFLDLPPDPSDAPPPQKKRSGAPLIAVLILLGRGDMSSWAESCRSCPGSSRRTSPPLPRTGIGTSRRRTIQWRRPLHRRGITRRRRST